MYLKNEFNWTLEDFIIAGLLLFGTGLLIHFLIRQMTNSKYKLIVILILIFVLILIWTELGVGILGTPLSGD